MTSAGISIIILLIMIVFYVTNKVALPLIPLSASILMVLFGVMEPAIIWSYYSSNIFMLIVGMMILGLSLFETGVAEYIGNSAVKFAGGKAKLAFLFLLIAIIPASALLSNTTTTATFMPILAGMVASSKGVLHEKKTMMPMAIAACIGGNLTLIGSTPQVIFAGMFAEKGMEGFGFFEYSFVGLPLVVIFLVYIFFVSDKLMDKTFGENPERSETMHDMLESLERLNTDGKERDKTKMILSSVIFAVTVISIIAIDATVMPTGTIAMIGAIASIFTCIPMKTVMKKLDWSTLVFFGAVMGFAKGFGDSGAGQLIADFVVSLSGPGSGPFVTFAILSIITGIMTQFMNNTGVAGLMAPVAFSLAASLGVSALPFAMGIIIASSVSISTPVATSPMTLVVGIGGYKFMDYVKIGGLLNVVLMIISIILIPIIWPF